MASTFKKLYLDGAADTMAPVAAIGLYDEFRDLTPTGTPGDEMIRKLADRLVKASFVRRQRDSEDRRQVLLSLTAKGEKVLRDLSIHHRAELQTVGPALMKALLRVLPAGETRSGKPAAG